MRAALLAALGLAVSASALAQPCGPDPVTFTSQLISADYDYAYGIATGDLDGDGDIDIAMAKGGAISSRGEVVWFENRDRPRFRQRRIRTGLPGAFEAITGYVDRDGDLDVAASVWGYPGGLMWFENRGRLRWCKRVLADPWYNGNSVLLHDLNGDGRLDVVSSAERGTNELRWWRNDGP